MSDQIKVTNVNEIFIASVTAINYIDLRKYLRPKLSRDAKVFPKKTVFYLLSGIHHGDGGVIGHSDSSLNSQFQTLFKILSNFCGYLDCKECKSIRGKPCSSKLSVWKEMEYDFKPPIPPKVKNNNKNLNLIQDFSEKMSISTSDGTSIRTAATRDRHSPVLRSPRIQKVRNIPVQKAPSMDDRSITEMSIHDMQMMMHKYQDSSVLSRSLSESDLSEIIGGATGSDPASPIHMMAPSDEDETHTGKLGPTN